jgi:hypothetical protein
VRIAIGATFANGSRVNSSSQLSAKSLGLPWTVEGDTVAGCMTLIQTDGQWLADTIWFQ